MRAWCACIPFKFQLSISNATGCTGCTGCTELDDPSRVTGGAAQIGGDYYRNGVKVRGNTSSPKTLWYTQYVVASRSERAVCHERDPTEVEIYRVHEYFLDGSTKGVLLYLLYDKDGSRSPYLFSPPRVTPSPLCSFLCPYSLYRHAVFRTFKSLPLSTNSRPPNRPLPPLISFDPDIKHSSL